MAQALVWGGILVYFFGWTFEQTLLLVSGMALSMVGLVWFHRQHGHPAIYGVISVVLALLPIFGPMIGLVIKPKGERISSTNHATGDAGDRSGYQSMRSLGIFFILVSPFAALATFREGVIMGAGLLCSGVFFWLAGFGGRKGWKYCPSAPLTAAIGALLIMFRGCFLSLAAH